MTRDEHLKWAPETKGHGGLELMGMLAVTGNLNSPHELRKFIEGFN